MVAIIGCGLFPDLGELQSGEDGAVESGAESSTKDASLDAPPSDAPSDAPFEAEAGPCKGSHGASGVVIDDKYCIDSTEITIDQFQEFLNAAKGNFTPYFPADGICAGIDPVPVGWGQQPNPYDGGAPLGSAAAGNLNYCAVHAYCAWAGKRMCGVIGDGGRGDLSTRTNASVSEWFNVCSRGDDKLHTYPYGVTYDQDACAVDTASGSTLPVSVASYPKCNGGYAGVFDMGGNVGEWANECSNTDASCAQPPCCAVHSLGVGYQGVPYSQCDYTFTLPLDLEDQYELGGRCCSDLN